MNNLLFKQYTTDYIAGVTSLRKPQKKSLEILADIFDSIDIKKGMDINAALDVVKAKYPTCTDFERDFMSLTFALATGVGKTRLMGVFIAYLYTQHNIKNFFIVAPNTTIYHKLNSDFSDTNSSKYVFRGLGCFSNPPTIIDADAYKGKNFTSLEQKSEVTIFIFNIDKFNKENSSMKQVSEYFGESFFDVLSKLDDLVLIMDESHHYRAQAGYEALNDLHPLLGLELTATPVVSATQKKFKNVVYEYNLAASIEDGYTRTPYAMASADVDVKMFGDTDIDKMMINDGIKNHENIRNKLQVYAYNNHEKFVKPFMMIVCQNTDHADYIYDYVTSSNFKGGYYANRTIKIHSKQKGIESEENTKLLLNIEKAENPIEIVIHINILKEGWDVNNLYTIVPLRTAASQVLREQMVGRGLRLPYGKRTGDKEIDSVVLTAHRNFSQLIADAQKSGSIFHAENIIKAEDIADSKVYTPSMQIVQNDYEKIENFCEEKKIDYTLEIAASMQKAIDEIKNTAIEVMCNNMDSSTEEVVEQVKTSVVEKLSQDKDIVDVLKEDMGIFSAFIDSTTSEVVQKVEENYISIPRLEVTNEGIAEYVFNDFELDCSKFAYLKPVIHQTITQNLLDKSDKSVSQGEAFDFGNRNPYTDIIANIQSNPEIDYAKNKMLISKLVKSLAVDIEMKYGTIQRNPIMILYAKEIAKEIYNQMLQHSHTVNNLLEENVCGVNEKNPTQKLMGRIQVNLFNDYNEYNIHDIVYYGITKGVYDRAKFDSRPELIFARILETNSPDVVRWLRPALNTFNITYNGNHNYNPDFVVETDKVKYLVEVKAANMVDNPDVLAKKERGVQYCNIVSKWCEANGLKPWKYMFIPDNEIKETTTFNSLTYNCVL